MAEIKIRTKHFRRSAGVLAVVALVVGIFTFGHFDQVSRAVVALAPSYGTTAGGTDVMIAGDFNPTPSLQGFSSAQCQALPIYDRNNPTSAASIGSTITLRDSRNNQNYTIRRLQDGKCWMIDNLKLELGVADADPTKDTTVLEPDNTGVPSNTPIYFTMDTTQHGPRLPGMTGNFTTSGFNTRDSSNNYGHADDPNADAWRQNNPSGNAYCQGAIADALAGSGVTLNSIGSKTNCGYLYNYYTATAGSMSQAEYGTGYPNEYNTPYSICPAGWRLPAITNPNPSGSGVSFYDTDTGILNDSMEANTLSTPGSYNSSLYQNWYPRGSFRGVASGGWDQGLVGQGELGYFWSSSLMSAGFGRDILISSNSINIGYSSYFRYAGHAVRCVALDDYTPTTSAAPPVPVVKFDGIPATDVSITDDGGLIRLHTPPHAAGVVDVTIDNGAEILTLTDIYTYIAPMTITGITPKEGVATGGTVVTITGTNIPPNPTVAFGLGPYMENANNVSVSADGTTITATTPDYGAGTVNVAVTGRINRVTLNNAFTYNSLYITLGTSVRSVQIGQDVAPSESGAFSHGIHYAIVTTNYSKGYNLSISTNQPSTNAHAHDLKHTSENLYVAGTANTCSWNDTTKVLTNTANPLSNNTWGFTLNTTDRDEQKLCQIPSSDSPLKVKSTTTDNQENRDFTAVYYGVKLDLNQAAGAYKAGVLYSAVANK